ncbi:phytanoyl-CoA dioxygenase family protein [Paenibacillus montanisoli]|uniref:Phytanoyl-CoA dioxygenase family protein n=1 Tax=Paenibacillus montanisoli TaxID=2081970 RepID=A0A328U509_9BACL|nr:phytanoyl-CoA dioxygenase family protein [Paenibacillus montanisoli]RAP77897.1 phytanoyl-CoA dioxygenase family protein [Paenibacillus montanisoli]
MAISLTEQRRRYAEDGFVVISLLTDTEKDDMLATFMEMHAAGPIPGCFAPVPKEQADGDILKLYPRMMHPHKVSDKVMGYMLHPKIMDAISSLLEEEPLAGQSMFYFKPPGAKGQALHQDNFYMKVEPGTCIAAWVALDDADEANGGLYIVPQTNTLDLQCPHKADPALSFTQDEVDVPDGLSPVPVRMKAGDVLFFNGSVIHGSYPNQSKDRFRRSFICHYAGSSITRIGSHFAPLYSRDGQQVSLQANEDGGPCGGAEYRELH